MTRVIYFFVAFIIWVMGTWPFVDRAIVWPVVFAGLVVAALAAALFRRIQPNEHPISITPARVFWALVYVPVFFYYVTKANLDVVYRALHPKMPIHPGIVKIKTNLKTKAAITALANSITLTPGTLTVDLTEDGFLYVHWINVKSDDVEQATEFIAQRFEWFLHRIFE